mgnify:CR=1 FL=1
MNRSYWAVVDADGGHEAGVAAELRNLAAALAWVEPEDLVEIQNRLVSLARITEYRAHLRAEGKREALIDRLTRGQRS